MEPIDLRLTDSDHKVIGSSAIIHNQIELILTGPWEDYARLIVQGHIHNINTLIGREFEWVSKLRNYGPIIITEQED